MKAHGIVIGLIDVPDEHTRAYNEWYDYDHLPEFVALPEILVGRRYYAPAEYRARRPGAGLEALRDGRGTYCSTYLVGTDDLDGARVSWGERSQDIFRAKRIFRHGAIAEVGWYRLQHIVARPDIPVRAEAIPYLGHRGLLMVLTRVADPTQRKVVHDWFVDVHAPDLLSVPGVIAAARFSFSEEEEGRFCNLYMLDGDPMEVLDGLEERRPDWLARGRAPAPGGGSELLFQSIYRSVIPTEYDFSID